MFGVDSGIITVAHELKAPLSLLRQLALSLEFEKDIDRVSQKMIGISERAIRQVNDLIKIARLEDGMFEMEPVNPRGVCNEIVSELTGLNQLKIVVDYRNKDRLVVGNRNLLFSVIYNFCINALNYGGEDEAYKVFVRNVKGKVQIGVRDFGPAVPVKVWREIQNGRVQKPIAMAMRPGSSGLGLYITSKFAEFMGGKLGARRHRDGTSFWVELNTSKQMSFLS